MTEIWMIYCTFPSRSEALKLAHTLLEKRLIACANVQDGVDSLYRWQGEIKQEKEAVLTAKTSKHRLDDAIAFITSHHSYELPCIAATPVNRGFAPFLQWVGEETT